GLVLSLPDHVAIGLVAEDSNVPAAHEVGDAAQVLRRSDATGRIVRRGEEDRLGPRRGADAAVAVIQVRPALVLLAELARISDRAAAVDSRFVGREVRTEYQDGVAGTEERLAEELLERLRARADDHVLCRDRDAEVPLVALGDGLAEAGEAQGRAVVRCLILD